MEPFRTILVAADFSENSQEAFAAACSLAVENKTRLFVLHVAEPNWVPEGTVYRGQQTVQFHAERLDEAHDEPLRQKMRERYIPHRPIDIEYRTRQGNAPEEILRAASEIGCDLIVMGSHGMTGLRRLLAGSVAIAVLRGARCPVLAIRSGVTQREAKPFRVILHPTDFSAGSAAALRVARALARDCGARLILMHVAPNDVVVEGSMGVALDVSSCTDALEAARRQVDGPDLKYPVETWFSQGEPADLIVRGAKEVGCDLIVMGTHGRTGLARLLMGNTAESVLPDASCPVMIVKEQGQVSPTTASEPSDQKVITSF